MVQKAVANPRDGVAFGLLPQRLEGAIREIDGDLHVYADLAQSVPQVSAGQPRIAGRIAHYDVTAPPPHHFIDSEILEMPAVRQIHVLAGVIGETEGFPNNGCDRRSRPILTPGLRARLAGIPQPGAEAGVEQRHNEPDYRRRVISHVGAGSGSRNRNGSAERNSVGPSVVNAGTIAEVGAAAMQRRYCEGLG